MMMFGGSPHMVAEPPRLAQKISAMIIGTGLNFRSLPSSTVAAARNRITVMLSMNMARMLLFTMKTMKSGTVRYFTSLASSRQSQRKKPAFPIPSTISIMPAMNRMVDQLIPEEDSPGFSRLIPEADGEKILQAEGIPDRRGAFHADAEYQHQHQKPADEGYNMPLDLFTDNQKKHRREQYHGQNLCRSIGS